MRFSLHQQNYKPNSTAGRHKPGGINLAGASHPQLPKAQYARGRDPSHNPSAEGGLWLHAGGWVWLPREAFVAESTGQTVQHHSPSRQAHTESRGVNKHLQSCPQLCHMQAAHHREAKGAHSRSVTHCKRLKRFPASLPYPKVIEEGWQTEFY